MNGVVPGVLPQGTVVPDLARGVQDPEGDPTGSTVETTVVVLHHLPPLTQRVKVRRPRPKDKVEVRAFGRVWLRADWVRISITGPHNLARNPNRRLGTGKGLGWRDRRGGLANLNRNRGLRPDGGRPRGSTIIEAKVPRTWVQ